MMLAYVASISIGVLDSGVGFSLICAAIERKNFEGGGWRESERTFLTFLFHVSDPSFHPTCSTTKKISKNPGIAQSWSGSCRSDSLP